MSILEYLSEENSVGMFVLALLGAVALDYLTGLIKAFCTHTLKSSIAKEGLIRKFALFAVVAACGLMDLVLPVETGYGICKLAAFSFAVSETLSIIENAAAAGVPIPNVLNQRLAQLSAGKEGEAEHENRD